jgi:hypothetical protein
MTFQNTITSFTTLGAPSRSEKVNVAPGGKRWYFEGKEHIRAEIVLDNETHNEVWSVSYAAEWALKETVRSMLIQRAPEE